MEEIKRQNPMKNLPYQFSRITEIEINFKEGFKIIG